MSARKGQRPVWLGTDRRGWDHCRVHVQVLRDPALGAYELATYLGLVAHADTGSGATHPSLETLASYADASVRRVREAIRTLEAAGYIRTHRRAGTSNEYEVLPPPELTARTPAPDAEVPEDRTPLTPARGAGPPGTTCRTTPAPRAAELEPRNENQGTTAPSAGPTPLPGLGEPAKVGGERGKVSDDPHKAKANELTRWLWDVRDAKPVAGFPAVQARIHEALQAGHSERDLRSVLPTLPAFSRNSLDLALSRLRPQRATVGPQQRHDTDRDGPTGRVDL